LAPKKKKRKKWGGASGKEGEGEGAGKINPVSQKPTSTGRRTYYGNNPPVLELTVPGNPDYRNANQEPAILL